MTTTVFYSWQTDSPGKVNRNFIEDSLKRALKKLKADADLVNSMRDQDLALDKDTKDLPGMPAIVEAILAKIDQCAVFVPDLTFVAETPEGRTVPNPNVLIEYGWALKSVGHARIVAVMNTAFGEPNWETLPFNMRHLRWPLTYTLAEGAETAQRADEKKKLVDDLAERIRAVLESVPAKPNAPVPVFEETKSTYDSAVFFDKGERLATWEGRFGTTSTDVYLDDEGAKMFLRVMPTVLTEPLTLKQVYDLARRQELRLRPFDHISTTGGERYDRNRYGAIAYRTGSMENDPIDELTQILKNRELWGVNTQPGSWWDREHKFQYFGNGYENAFSRALGHYLKFARDNLELPLPLRVIAGFTGVEDFKMFAPSGLEFRGFEQFRGRAIEPEIIFEGMVEDWETPPQEFLMPFFEQVWHDLGLDDHPDVPN